MAARLVAALAPSTVAAPSRDHTGFLGERRSGVLDGRRPDRGQLAVSGCRTSDKGHYVERNKPLIRTITDPVTSVVVILGMTTLAAAASYLPARRAMRADASRVLRAD